MATLQTSSENYYGEVISLLQYFSPGHSYLMWQIFQDAPVQVTAIWCDKSSKMPQCRSQPFNVMSISRCPSAVHNYFMWQIFQDAPVQFKTIWCNKSSKMLQCSSQPFNVTSFPRCFSAVHNHSMWCLLQAWLYDLLYEWSLYYGIPVLQPPLLLHFGADLSHSSCSTLAPLQCRSQPFQLLLSCSAPVQTSAIEATPILYHFSEDASHSSSFTPPIQCKSMTIPAALLHSRADPSLSGSSTPMILHCWSHCQLFQSIQCDTSASSCTSLNVTFSAVPDAPISKLIFPPAHCYNPILSFPEWRQERKIEQEIPKLF